MFDTRLIYQVVDWERRIEIENDKHKIPRPATITAWPAQPKSYRGERESIFTRIFNLNRDRRLTARSTEPAGTLDSPACCESSAQ
jgi:hypothetical protein